MKALHEVRNYPSGFMVWEDCYDDMGFLAHWHREIELIYVRRGKTTVCIEDMELIGKEGDLIIIDTGNFHYSPTPRQKNRLDFLVFDPSIISPHYHYAHFFSPLVTAEQMRQYGMEEETSRLFDMIQNELKERSPYYQEIVSARLQEFMYRLRRHHRSNVLPPPERSHRLETLHDIQRFLTYIDQHYHEPITLSDAAEELKLSKNHFSQLFTKIVGINFISYLNTVRIEHAADMLRNSDRKVIDIALSCGFENIRSFNRCFRQYTGYSPTQFMTLPDAVRQSFPFYKRKLDEKKYVQGTSSVVMLTPVSEEEDSAAEKERRPEEHT